MLSTSAWPVPYISSCHPHTCTSPTLTPPHFPHPHTTPLPHPHTTPLPTPSHHPTPTPSHHPTPTPSHHPTSHTLTPPHFPHPHTTPLPHPHTTPLPTPSHSVLCSQHIWPYLFGLSWRKGNPLWGAWHLSGEQRCTCAPPRTGRKSKPWATSLMLMFVV